MCFLCDGGSVDQWRDLMAARVELGWGMTYVEADRPWTYTLGLIENFGHPELIVVGPDARRSSALLDELCCAVEAGSRLDEGEVVLLDGSCCQFDEVHPRQIEHGVFASWTAYYEREAETPPFSALQVIVPDDWFCAEHARRQQRERLSSQADVLHPMPNRAQRRARGRGRT